MSKRKSATSQSEPAKPVVHEIAKAVTGDEAAAEGIGSRFGGEIYRFIGDLEVNIDKLFQLVSSSTGIEATKIRDQALAKLGMAKSIANSLKSGALDRGRQYVGKADGYVHNQPWQAIGIGAAIGFTAGALLARRSEA